MYSTFLLGKLLPYIHKTFENNLLWSLQLILEVFFRLTADSDMFLEIQLWNEWRTPMFSSLVLQGLVLKLVRLREGTDSNFFFIFVILLKVDEEGNENEPDMNIMKTNLKLMFPLSFNSFLMFHAMFLKFCNKHDL